jgi:hypothetical protein
LFAPAQWAKFVELVLSWICSPTICGFSEPKNLTFPLLICHPRGNQNLFFNHPVGVGVKWF